MSKDLKTKCCKYCKTEIPANAKVCPQCRKKQGGGKVKWVIIGIVVVGIIGAAVGNNQDKKVKDVTPAKDNTEITEKVKATEKQTEKTEFAVGEVAEYDNVQVSVLSYEESSGNDWGSPADGKVFVFANVEITNNTNKEMSVSSMISFDTYCDDYKLDFSSDALIASSTDKRQQMDGSIAPGKKLNGWLGFEVPSDWKTIEINYKDNVWLSSNFKFVIEK